MIQFDRVTYVGGAIDDHKTFAALPDELRHFLLHTNGVIAFGGGLHIRGACSGPAWHSLAHGWVGSEAFHRRYRAVLPADVPFAEDAVGDQWLMRDGAVMHLAAETGEVDQEQPSLANFFAAIAADPIETLGLHPLLQFEAEGGRLAPGQLLSGYPPFCTAEAANGVCLAAVPASERLHFLADLARQLPASGQFQFKVND